MCTPRKSTKGDSPLLRRLDYRIWRPLIENDCEELFDIELVPEIVPNWVFVSLPGHAGVFCVGALGYDVSDQWQYDCCCWTQQLETNRADCSHAFVHSVEIKQTKNNFSRSFHGSPFFQLP